MTAPELRPPRHATLHYHPRRSKKPDRRERGVSQATYGRPPLLAGLLLLFLGAVLLGMGGAAAASTPQGTWITNTASISFGYSQTVRGSVLSNAADTMVELSDTAPPIFLTAYATPSVATNGGCTVIFSAHLDDSSTIENVLINLAPLGQYEATSFRNDGISPDTLGGDSLWNLAVFIDPTVMGDTFWLRTTARDQRGNVAETFIRLVVVDTSPSMTTIRSLGWNLRHDVRIAGNALTLSIDRSDSFSKVLFEYRQHAARYWSPCAVGAWSGSNPDTTGPNWGIYWNMETLPDDTYLVRATAYDLAGRHDASPAFLRVVKDSRDSWINEWTDTRLGQHVRRQRYQPPLSDSSIVVEGTSLYIQPTAVAPVDSCWFRMTVYTGPPPGITVPHQSSGLMMVGGGVFRRFEREDGTTTFPDYVTIGMPYSDDGMVVSDDRVAIYRYDAASGQWLKEGGRVDSVRKIIWLNTTHFSDYAVFRSLGTGLEYFQIFPNPFKPNDGDPTTGVEHVPGVANTGIVFDYLPQNAKVRIFTTLGALIVERTSDASGTWQWDARNARGEKVASGVYVYVVTAPDGQTRTGKLVIIR